MKPTTQTPAGIAYARSVLASDCKTTNADLNFLTVAQMEIRAGRRLTPAQDLRLSRLMARALSAAALAARFNLISTSLLRA